MGVEPIYTLVLRLDGFRRNLLHLDSRTEGKAVSRVLIDHHDTLRRLGLLSKDTLDDVDELRLDLVVLVADGNRHGQRNLVKVTGDVEKARVPSKDGVDEGPVVDLGAVGEQDGVFASPAEARGADGQLRAFFLAELLEEALDDGLGLADAIVEYEGDETCDGFEEVPAKEY